jgi:hypothetical protein
MARQRFFGRGWISKPGELEDIIHRDLSDIEGDMAVNMMTYGQVSQVFTEKLVAGNDKRMPISMFLAHRKVCSVARLVVLTETEVETNSIYFGMVSNNYGPLKPCRCSSF